MIESAYNLKIKEIFAKFGGDEFRKTEKKLAKFIEKNVSNAIVSTGGGFYKVPNLKKLGTIIYLKSDFENIIKRIETSPNAKKKLAKSTLFNSLTKAGAESANYPFCTIDPNVGVVAVPDDRRLSNTSISENISSRLMVSISLIGSIEPST